MLCSTDRVRAAASLYYSKPWPQKRKRVGAHTKYRADLLDVGARAMS